MHLFIQAVLTGGLPCAGCSSRPRAQQGTIQTESCPHGADIQLGKTDSKEAKSKGKIRQERGQEVGQEGVKIREKAAWKRSLRKGGE